MYTLSKYLLLVLSFLKSFSFVTDEPFDHKIKSKNLECSKASLRVNGRDRWALKCSNEKQKFVIKYENPADLAFHQFIGKEKVILFFNSHVSVRGKYKRVYHDSIYLYKINGGKLADKLYKKKLDSKFITKNLCKVTHFSEGGPHKYTVKPPVKLNIKKNMITSIEFSSCKNKNKVSIPLNWKFE